MRELRFRAWVTAGTTPHMVHEPACSTLICKRGYWVSDQEGNGFTLMQYTGLKDKNGVEIYEGDILRIDGGGKIVNAAVGFEYGCYVLDNPPWLGQGYANPELKCYINMAFISVEVIGNIYENSDLLESP